KFWVCDLRDPGRVADLAMDLKAQREPFDNVLGFTFHPGFATNGQVFINYNEPTGRPEGARVSRFTCSSRDPLVIDPASEKVILHWLSGGHNGCTLAFGTDGMLYVSTGDATNPDPPDWPYRTGQDISDLLSSILRVDVDHTTNDAPYSIPSDNPFIGMAAARPPVWGVGLLQPRRLRIA